MPRQPRLDAPGAIQHVIVRGIEKRDIFIDEDDRRDFVERLARLLPEEDVTCLAWALMPNHAHLCLRTGSFPLSHLMARLGTGYVLRFNKRHDRVGHLFQNRFKSVLVDRDSQLEILVRYIHLNPLRSGLVGSLAELESYPWAGHATLVGRRNDDVVAVREVLSWFGTDPAAARLALRAWMEQAPDLGDRAPAEGPRAVLEPADEFVPPSLCRLRRPARAGRLTAPAAVREGGLDGLLAWVCGLVGADQEAVRAGRRTASASSARALTAYLATSQLGLRAADVCRALHLDSGSASRAVTRGRELTEELADGRSRSRSGGTLDPREPDPLPFQPDSCPGGGKGPRKS